MATPYAALQTFLGGQRRRAEQGPDAMSPELEGMIQERLRQKELEDKLANLTPPAPLAGPGELGQESVAARNAAEQTASTGAEGQRYAALHNLLSKRIAAENPEVPQVQQALTEAGTYNLPEVTRMRQDQQQAELAKVTEPQRVAGQYGLLKQKIASQGAVEAAGARANQQDVARFDRGFQANINEVNKLAKPFEDQFDRLSRLTEAVNQVTPQADAVVAPELLTVMAGGQGSGLRMNEAEIRRILGGRTNWQNIVAALNKWQIDPSKGLAITPAQREQIRALIGVVTDRLTNKVQQVDAARQALIDAPSVEAQRQIAADLHRMLASNEGAAQPGETPAAATPDDYLDRYFR